jgi:UDPglucose 6-dehydrogenase
MLATKISFMNEVANIAERCGADIEQVRLGMGSDPRIGYHFIYPGAGYGGSCFPKDVRALAKSGSELGYAAELLNAVEDVNNRQKNKIFDNINSHYDGDLAGKTIALWGLSFKPRTDDMREAPSRVLMESLWAAGASVRAYDPKAMEATSALYPDQKNLELCESAVGALEGADALAIVTEWQEFRSPDFEQIVKLLAEPVIFDGRNLYDPEILRAKEISYYAIGRGNVTTDSASIHLRRKTDKIKSESSD